MRTGLSWPRPESLGAAQPLLDRRVVVVQAACAECGCCVAGSAPATPCASHRYSFNVNDDKREQVFVSSTYLDLKEERQEVIQTLLEADCIPAGMELFPASDDDKWTLIKRVIDDSDYYLVVVGGRYGSVDPDRGLSFTEMEFDYAVEQKIPVMGFLHGDPGQIIGDKLDLDPENRRRLEAFRQKVEARMVKYWTTPEALGGQVAKSLIQIRKTHPAEGWIRASHAVTPELEKEIAELRAENARLSAALEAARTVPAELIEGIAKGDDEYTINYTMKYWTKDAIASGHTWRGALATAYGTVAGTWDRAFAALGPLMMDEADEMSLKGRLDTLAAELLVDTDYRPKDYGRGSEVTASNEDWQQLKVQLIALGLIEQSIRRRGVNDKATYWTLTTPGQAHLMRLRAVRRPSHADRPATEGG